MKNKQYNNYGCIGLLILVMLIMCGCSGGNVFQNAYDYNKFEKETVELLAEHKDTSEMRVLCANETQFIYMEQIWERKDGAFAFDTEFYLYDYKDGKKEQIQLEGLSPEDTTYFACFVDDIGMVVIDRFFGTVFVYDEKFDCVMKKDLKDVVFADGQQLSGDINVNEMWCDNNIIYIINKRSQFLALDMHLDGFLIQEAVGGIWNILPNKDKNTMIWDGGHYFVFDSEKKILSRENGYNGLGNLVFDNIYVGDSQYDFYFFSNNSADESPINEGVFGVKNGKVYRVFQFAAMDVLAQRLCSVSGIVSDGQEGYRLICFSQDGKKLLLSHLTPSEKTMDYSLTNGKNQIDLGCMYISRELENVVNNFNADSTDYRINIINYQSIYDDYDDALIHFNLDILDGKNIDMICLYGLNQESLLGKGVLQDLNEYFSYSNVVAKDDFTDSFWNNITNQNGEVLYIYPSYMITGYVSNEVIDFSNLNDKKELLEDNKLFFGECNSELLLTNILQYSGNRYVDKEQGEIHFKEKDFQSLLQLIKEQRRVSVEDIEANTMFCKGDAYAIQAEILNPYWYFYYEKLFGKGFRIISPGFDGPIIWELSSTLGVVSTSDEKMGAYQFLDYLFSPNVYHSNFSYDGFPVLKAVWEDWENILLATEPYIDAYGVYNVPRDRTLGYAEGKCVIEAGSISREDVERMREITENAVYLKPMSYEYINIIVEEADGYFENQRGLEETCDVIEHRMKMAIAE